MKRQIPELTFQIGTVEDLSTRVASKRAEVAELFKTAPQDFPVQLSLHSAAVILEGAGETVGKALGFARHGLAVAEAVVASPDATIDGRKYSEPEVAALGVAAITLKQSAETAVVHAQYHIDRARHLTSQSAPKAQ